MTITHPPTSEINVTPFLDVLLVLLVTFMTIVMAQHRTMDVQLPQPCAGVCEGNTEQIVLEIGPGGYFALNHTTVAAGALRSYLASVYADRPEKIIFVRGLPGLTYQEMVAAMDVARSAGVRVIGLGER